MKNKFLVFVVVLVCVLSDQTGNAAGAELRMMVHPIQGPEATRKAFQPLVDFIAKVTGRNVQLVTSYDYAEYWMTTRSGTDLDLVLDSAFMTDFRIKRQGFEPLVKFPGKVSYSLVSRGEDMVLGIDELVGKRVASLNPPAPAGMYLAEFFTNSFRQPVVVGTSGSQESLKKLWNKEVDAAMLPTPFVNQVMATGPDLSVVATTRLYPHNAISAGPRLDKQTKQKVREALIEASNTEKGRELLEKVGIENFEPANADLYDGLMKKLVDSFLVPGTP